MNMRKGFTLVELLVVAPIVILVIGALVGVIISMVGTASQAGAENNLTYKVNDALNQIQTDVKSSNAFLAENSFTLNSPQGAANGGSSSLADTTNNFFNVGSTTGDALILRTNGMTKNPTDPTAEPVYIANSPNACGATNYTDNNVEQVNVVYFTTNNGDGTYTLWRRTLRDPSFALGLVTGTATCSNLNPWQKPTCNPSFVKSQTFDSHSWCILKDSALITGTSLNFNVQYYPTASSSTIDPDAVDTTKSVADRNKALAGTDTADVAISASIQQSGRTITEDGSIRATRNTTLTNTSPSEDSLVAPAAPTVKVTFDPNYGVTFAWNSTDPNATYTLKYQVNGGSTQTIASTGLDSSCTGASPPCVTLPIFTRLTSVSGTITAINDVGSSPISNTASLTTPAWNPMIFSNLYNDYNTGYGSAEYALTSDGIVVFQGLVRHPQAGTASEWITDLPPAYRPVSPLIFAVNSNGSDGRVDVYSTDGSVRATTDSTTAGAFISLSNIQYVAASAGNTWKALTPQNSWVNYGSGWPTPQWTSTPLGRIEVIGLIKSGTTANYTAFYTDPATAPYGSTIITPTQNAAGWGESAITPAGSMTSYIAATSGSSGWQSLDVLYQSTQQTAATTLQPLSLGSGWVNYSTSYAGAGYWYSNPNQGGDGLVQLTGLIKAGTVSSGSDVLATDLPACIRPSQRLIFELPNDATGGRLDVTATGQLIQEGVTNGWLALDGITYLPDPNDPPC